MRRGDLGGSVAMENGGSGVVDTVDDGCLVTAQSNVDLVLGSVEVLEDVRPVVQPYAQRCLQGETEMERDGERWKWCTGWQRALASPSSPGLGRAECSIAGHRQCPLRHGLSPQQPPHPHCL